MIRHRIRRLMRMYFKLTTELSNFIVIRPEYFTSVEVKEYHDAFQRLWHLLKMIEKRG